MTLLQGVAFRHRSRNGIDVFAVFLARFEVVGRVRPVSVESRHQNRYNTTVASLVGIYVLIQLVLAVPFVIILWGVSRLVSRLSPWLRTTAFLLTTTLLFTPGWAPATITVVPIPFGALLGVAVFTFRWDELTDVVQLAPPSWYWFAFPATAVLVYAFRTLTIRNIARWTEPESRRS